MESDQTVLICSLCGPGVVNSADTTCGPGVINSADTTFDLISNQTQDECRKMHVSLFVKHSNPRIEAFGILNLAQATAHDACDSNVADGGRLGACGMTF